AGASTVGPFTITAFLPTSNDLSLGRRRGFDRVSVSSDAAAEGWHLPESPGFLPVEVVFPLVLTGYGTASDEPDRFPGLNGVERTLYVVASEEVRLNQALVYVAQDPNPKKVFFSLQPK